MCRLASCQLPSGSLIFWSLFECQHALTFSFLFQLLGLALAFFFIARHEREGGMRSDSPPCTAHTAHVSGCMLLFFSFFSFSFLLFLLLGSESRHVNVCPLPALHPTTMLPFDMSDGRRFDLLHAARL